jgi:hypothetical protein
VLGSNPIPRIWYIETIVGHQFGYAHRFQETGLTAALSRICYIREFRETSTNIYHLEFFMPVDAYTGEITLDNIPKGDLDDGIIKAVKWLHRSELGDLVVYPEWMGEEWFWQDAHAGFPQTKYTGVGVE